MRRFTLIIPFILVFLTAHGQGVAVNDSGTEPDSSAMLDIGSTTKGLLIPRMSSAQRMAIPNPGTGLMVFDLDEEKFYCYAGSEWIAIMSGFTTLVRDADSDTRITVEQTSDDDIIRFYTEGNEFARMDGKALKLKDQSLNILIGENTGINDDGTGSTNIGIGHTALANNTGGSYNIAIGSQALSGDLTGHSNTAIGWFSMAGTTSGQSNISIGSESMRYITGGSNNLAIGNYALNQIAGGDLNVAVGRSASVNNIGGNRNTVVGAFADLRNTGGSENVIVGEDAGRNSVAHSKSGNVLIGYRAGYYNTTDNKLYIENSSDSMPLIYGEFDNDLLRINGKLQTTLGLTDTDNDTKIQLEKTADDDLIRFDLGGAEHFVMDGPRLEVYQSGKSVFIGSEAGMSDDLDNNYNVFVGSEAGKANVTGSLNTIIGASAFRDNLSGQQNTGVGFGALDKTTGNLNSSVGAYALHANISGNENTAIGAYAMRYNTTGLDNTAVGVAAMEENVGGGGNVAVGKSALRFNTFGTSNCAVGNSALNANTTGARNVAVGSIALADNMTGVENTAVGHFAFRENTTASYGAAFGAYALTKNTTGEFNCAFGANTLQLNTTGGGNVAVGRAAMFNNTTGGSNTAVGYEALVENTTASNNTAFGALALRYNETGVYNVAMGNSALLDNVIGNRNVAIGHIALRDCIGSHNVAVGVDAGQQATGSDNVFIGFEAGRTTTTGSGNVFIGRSAGEYSNFDNRLIIANSNTTTPLIAGSFADAAVTINGDLSVDDLWIGNETISDDGSYLSINAHWNPVSDNVYDLGGPSNRWDDVWATNGVIQTSDENDKRDIRQITYGLQEILNLTPISFAWKDRPAVHRKLGLSAQQVKDVLPETVVSHHQVIDDDESMRTEPVERLGVYYADLIPVLIKAIQEQQEIISDQQSQINTLNTRLELLENE